MTESRVSLDPKETDLVGRWFRKGGGVEADATCLRIDRLVSGVLERLGKSSDGWETLYRDPADGRLWEHTYPSSHLHGGGPPRLTVIEWGDAVSKYPQPWGEMA